MLKQETSNLSDGLMSTKLAKEPIQTVLRVTYFITIILRRPKMSVDTK